MRRFALAAAILVSTLAHAQSQRQPDRFETYRRATISIGRVIDAGNGPKFSTIGSGVIVSTDPRHAVLITAKHVVFDPRSGNIPDVVNIRIPHGDSASADDLGIPVQLIANHKNVWQSLPDGSDIAAVPLPNLSKYGRVTYAISVDDFATDDDLYPGASVMVFGYPAILGEDFLTAPLARGGLVSWVDPTGPLFKRFLIDSNIVNGNSGGPVFHERSGMSRSGGMSMTDSPAAFLGIVVANAAERAAVFDGQMNPVNAVDPQTGHVSQMFARVLSIGGIGIVEPASKVRKLVDQFIGKDGR
ncbi:MULTISPECIES: trypsin-like serine peptidase [Burkholderia]|nr:MULTISPECIES: serine protease [Burkholderia]EKS9794810.1 trypsin-like peptidase domain-containing protein [Burkholderia cepacia]EKS9802765.1 trypsin-like peptidase domain-containing protein [Burkholderia cepacia]EKS9809272.1 trypsin-like peptidase domain-containing protein [Burkholderia cepacia]EKS9818133.1 trypsin-like peptidase domain-containing protein [Burkholderia cepacia]EKS9824127.1 trypsin-like peptidase domain-containing protein [Burkholderia cepacia]